MGLEEFDEIVRRKWEEMEEEEKFNDLTGEALLREYLKTLYKTDAEQRELRKCTHKLFENCVAILENLQKEEWQTESYFQCHVPAIDEELEGIKQKLKWLETAMKFVLSLTSKRAPEEARKCEFIREALCQNFPEEWMYLIPEGWKEDDKPIFGFISKIFCPYCDHFKPRAK